MYIVTVIPIKKGLPKEYLTYFSSTNIPLGHIVVIPIRFKNINAIVVNIENARDLKSDLKTRNYKLKKIIQIKGPSPFTQSFFTACKKMKQYTQGNLGAIIKTFLPSVFLENYNELEIPIIEEAKQKKTEVSSNIKHEKLIFQNLTPDRMSWYRTLIREAFAKKESVFICVPTRYDIEKIKTELFKGIEIYVFSFHSDMTKKILISNYNKAITENHPILIIGTGMFLSIPRADIKTIIIEHESSDAYKQLTRPYLDIRSFAEILCSLKNIKLIFGDSLLRPETLYRNENKELGEVSAPLFRIAQTDRQLVINMKEETNAGEKKKFSVLSETTKKMITYAISKNESVFLFSVRKGLAPVTVCHDCNNVLLCPNCSTPIVLYETKKKIDGKTISHRLFMCNKCGRKETAEIRCPECLSWNLIPLGIGTSRVYQEVKKLFPKANIIQIDKESTPTIKEAKNAITQFNKNRGSILIGTEMVFSYLDTNIIHSAIISLDGLMSIPSFNITQKILHIIEKLNYITERNLIIQTRLEENHILRHILSGNVLPLYREDLKERKQFGYPPFKRLIKITFSGTTKETEKARELLNKLFNNYDPQIFSAFIGKVKGQYVTNTVIKIDPTLWPLPINDKIIINKDLSNNLSLLPPSFLINVDPEDLL